MFMFQRLAILSLIDAFVVDVDAVASSPVVFVVVVVADVVVVVVATAAVADAVNVAFNVAIADASVACASVATGVAVALVVAIPFAASPTFIVHAYDANDDAWYVYAYVMFHAYLYRVPYRNWRTGTAKYVSEMVKQRTYNSLSQRHTSIPTL